MTVLKDEYLADGTRLFNPSKPHGTIYCDGFQSGKWVQDGVTFGADRLPIDYIEKQIEVDAAVEPITVDAAVEQPKKLHWKTQKKLEEALHAGASGAT